MATLEELLAQYLQTPVLPPSAATSAPADTSGMAELFNTQATEQQRLESLKAGVASGAVKPNAALITQANALQSQSDEKEKAYADSVTMVDAMLGDVDALLEGDAYKHESGQLAGLADSLFGNVSKSVRGVMSGGESLDVRKRLSSLAAKGFFQNYEKLKGAGAISDKEAATAQAAFQRIFGKEGAGNTAIDIGMSEPGMKQALIDMQSALKKGQDRLKQGLRWDEKAGKAIPAAEWREKYRGDPKATGDLPTEDAAAKADSTTDYPKFTASEDYTAGIDALTPGTQFYFDGKLYKKGIGKKISEVIQ